MPRANIPEKNIALNFPEGTTPEEMESAVKDLWDTLPTHAPKPTLKSQALEAIKQIPKSFLLKDSYDAVKNDPLMWPQPPELLPASPYDSIGPTPSGVAPPTVQEAAGFARTMPPAPSEVSAPLRWLGEREGGSNYPLVRDVASALHQGTLQNLSYIALARGALQGDLSDMHALNRWRDATAGQKAELDAQLPDAARFAHETLAGAGASAFQMLPPAAAAGAISKNPKVAAYASIMAAALSEFSQALTVAKDSGFSPAEQLKYAMTQGVIEAAPALIMQKAGLGGSESVAADLAVQGLHAADLSPMSILTGAARTLVPEEFEENVTDQLHLANQLYHGLITWDQYKQMILPTAAATTAQTAAMVGGMATPNAAATLFGNHPGPESAAPTPSVSPPTAPGQTTQEQTATKPIRRSPEDLNVEGIVKPEDFAPTKPIRRSPEDLNVEGIVKPEDFAPTKPIRRSPEDLNVEGIVKPEDFAPTEAALTPGTERALARKVEKLGSAEKVAELWKDPNTRVGRRARELAEAMFGTPEAENAAQAPTAAQEQPVSPVQAPPTGPQSPSSPVVESAPAAEAPETRSQWRYPGDRPVNEAEIQPGDILILANGELVMGEDRRGGGKTLKDGITEKVEKFDDIPHKVERIVRPDDPYYDTAKSRFMAQEVEKRPRRPKAQYLDTTNQALQEFRREIAAAGIRPNRDTKGFDNIGGRTGLPFGKRAIIRKNGRYTWDQALQRAVEMGLAEPDTEIGQFFDLFRGPVKTKVRLQEAPEGWVNEGPFEPSPPMTPEEEYEADLEWAEITGKPPDWGPGALAYLKEREARSKRGPEPEPRGVNEMEPGQAGPPVETASRGVNEMETRQNDIVRYGGKLYRVVEPPPDIPGKILKDLDERYVGEWETIGTEVYKQGEPGYLGAQRELDAQEKEELAQTDLAGNPLPPSRTASPIPTNQQGDMFGAEKVARPEPENPNQSQVPGTERTTVSTKAAMRGEAMAAPEPGAVEGEMARPHVPAEDDNQKVFPLEGPELFRLFREASGKTPKVMPGLKGKRGILGLFSSKRGDPSSVEMMLDAGMFAGKELNSLRGKTKLDQAHVDRETQRLAKANGLNPEDIIARREYDRRNRQHVVNFYNGDETYANRAFAHEVGHWVDSQPDTDLNRGNLLGRVAVLKGYMNTLLEGTPGGETVLTRQERARLNASALRAAKAELGATATGKEIRSRARGIYQDSLAAEIKKRGLVSLHDIVGDEKAVKGVWNELQELSRWWRGGPHTQDRQGKELYADAISVMVNNPAALAKRAPTFYKAFQAYFERKPEVKSVYDQIQKEIGNGDYMSKRLESIFEMHRRGEQLQRDILERGRTKRTPREHLERFLDLAKNVWFEKSGVKRRGQALDRRGLISDEDNPEHIVRQWTRIDSLIDTFGRAVGKVMQNVDDVDEQNLGAYTQLLRSATERAHMANPGNISGKVAADTLQHLKQDIGAERTATVEKVNRGYLDQRKKFILPELREGRVHSAETMDAWEANDAYVPFKVQEYEKELDEGGGSASPSFHKQYGTFKDISNPFVRRIFQDAAQVYQAKVNLAKLKTVEMFKKHFGEEWAEADKKWVNGKWQFQEPRSRKQGLLRYREDGVNKAIVVPKNIVNDFDRTTGEMTKLINGLALVLNTVPRAAFVTYSPTFPMMNPARDFADAVVRLPGGVAMTPIRLGKQMPKAWRDAWNDVYRGETTADIEGMRVRGVIQARGTRMYSVTEPGDAETEFRRWQKRFDLRPNLRDKMWEQLPPNRWQQFGEVGEIATKIASERYLKEHFSEMHQLRQDKLVTERGGTPDYRSGGQLKPVVNLGWLFGNVKLKGLQATWDAFRDQPANTMMKFATYDIAPKLLLFAADVGIWDHVIKEMFDYDTDDYVKKMMARIPEYQKKNYTILPLWMNEKGQTAAIRLPAGHAGQFFQNMTWTALKQKDGLLPSEIAQAANTLNPLQKTPPLQMLEDSVRLALGGEPIHPYYGTPRIPRDAAKAGGTDAAKALAKSEWNDLLGGFYRFGPMSVEEECGAYAKLRKIPFLGRTLTSFVIVTDQGLSEEADRRIAVKDRQVGKLELKRNDLISDHVKAMPSGADNAAIAADINKAWNEAKEQGFIAGSYKWIDFRKRYMVQWDKRTNRDPMAGTRRYHQGTEDKNIIKDVEREYAVK